MTTSPALAAVEDPPAAPLPRPWTDAAIILARSLIVAALVVAACAAAYLVGLRTGQAENTRTRAAVCQILDHLGADPSTEAQAAPCQDLPR